MAKKKTSKKSTKVRVETIIHDEAKRKNIPTAEYQSIMQKTDQAPIQLAYERRNRDLDPQLVWRGKDQQDWSDLIVSAPPLYIQEKVHPKALIDDLMSRTDKNESIDDQLDLFSDFNGLPSEGAKTEFYQHDSHWSNRMILGDSLQVMASLAEREGLRGKVQCIYFDPPYGIKFNSNFQWSTTTNKVTDGKADHITREPEQVKAFRDTWRDGVHSYLTYLRDRLVVARDLLSDSGSIFIQIGNENVHRVRVLLDEVFGDENFVSLITFVKTSGQTDNLLASVSDYLLWYAKDRKKVKCRQLKRFKDLDGEGGTAYNSVRYPDGATRRLDEDEKRGKKQVTGGGRIYRIDNLTSQSPGTRYTVNWQGRDFYPKGYWKTQESSMGRLLKSYRVEATKNGLYYVRYFDDYPVFPIVDNWTDTGVAGFTAEKRYVVETSAKVVERCIQMATDPGDLVVDPTCGSGTTAFVSEQWGRRWITIDTSRVALALARARIMGARYPFYLLSDSHEGQLKEAELAQRPVSSQPVYGRVRQGFVYERVPHIMLSSIANNAEIDVIWEKWEAVLNPILSALNSSVKQSWQEWEVPREVDPKWNEKTRDLHGKWWEARLARQAEIDKSISTHSDTEVLYDRPYIDKKRIRVAGPFTVESLSPHRVLALGAENELIDPRKEDPSESGKSFLTSVLENLKNAGVQQAHKEGRISFTSLNPWPGHMICGEAKFVEGSSKRERKAAIFVGPEFGTVSRPDLVEAAKEAGDADFDVLIACAFNFDARASDFSTLGRIPVMKARMNADLHMAEDLKNTGQGNLFVVFGEPDIEILQTAKKESQIRVKINGVDVFHPNTGEVVSDNADGIACWLIDTDYNEESFFVRHAYFLGASDPYKALKSSLKAEIDEDAWATLNSDTSRPFEKPKSGRIAVKVINHLGDEVMKVFKVN